MKWRVEKMCSTCPFAKSGPGRSLQRGLRPGRWREILKSLRLEQVFHCHNTTDFDDEGEAYGGLVCAGALQWQHKRGLQSNYERVMERIKYFAETSHAKRV